MSRFDPSGKALRAWVRMAQDRETADERRARLYRLHGLIPPRPTYEQGELL